MFTQNQVQTFKEVFSFLIMFKQNIAHLIAFICSFLQAFQMIDQDKDGFISKNDIRQTFDSLGK